MYACIYIYILPSLSFFKSNPLLIFLMNVLSIYPCISSKSSFSCVFTSIGLLLLLFIYLCMYACMHVCMYVCYVMLYVYVMLYIYIYMCVCVCVSCYIVWVCYIVYKCIYVYVVWGYIVDYICKSFKRFVICL